MTANSEIEELANYLSLETDDVLLRSKDGIEAAFYRQMAKNLIAKGYRREPPGLAAPAVPGSVPSRADIVVRLMSGIYGLRHPQAELVAEYIYGLLVSVLRVPAVPRVQWPGPTGYDYFGRSNHIEFDRGWNFAIDACKAAYEKADGTAVPSVDALENVIGAYFMKCEVGRPRELAELVHDLMTKGDKTKKENT